MPSYTRQCVVKVFMDYMKDFNEKTLDSAQMLVEKLKSCKSNCNSIVT
jgi:hypothetical protein